MDEFFCDRLKRLAEDELQRLYARSEGDTAKAEHLREAVALGDSIIKSLRNPYRDRTQFPEQVRAFTYHITHGLLL